MPAVDTYGTKKTKAGKPVVVYARPTPKPPPQHKPRKPTYAELEASRVKARTQQARTPPPPRPKAGPPAPKPKPKRSPIFGKHPVAGMRHAERNAIGALAELHASNPTAYQKRLDATKKGHGVGPLIATATTKTLASGTAGLGAAIGQRLGGPVGKLNRNVGKDLAEMTVTFPSSAAKLAVDTAHRNQALLTGHPVKAFKGDVKLTKELAAPYVQLGRHPIKTTIEHPVQTALMVQPIPRIPGLAAGRLLRLAGKQTLERPPAELPGTTLQEARTASRSAPRNARQAKRDKTGTATVSERAVHRRVDEFRDATAHAEHRTMAEAVAEADAATHGQPAHVREAARQAAREEARTQAREDTGTAFGRQFGANQRPQVTAAEVELAKREREAAGAAKQQARTAHEAAKARVEAALEAARKGRATRKTSQKLTALEAEHRAALRETASEQRAAQQARVEYERAHAGARVSAVKVKGSDELTRLHGERAAAERAHQAEQRAAAQAEADFRKAHANARVASVKPKTSPILKDLTGQRRATIRASTPTEVIDARGGVSAADKHVAALERELAQAEQKASRLEGVTEGRHRAGRMTKRAGSAAADAAEYIGHIKDALHEARQISEAARAKLKEAEGAHQTKIAESTKAIDDRIRAERRRIAGVPPAEAQALLDAIDRRDAAPARVQAAADRISGVEQRIAAERARVSGVAPVEHQRLQTAIDRRATAPQRVRGARARVRDLESQVGAEHARLSGVPHAQATELINALYARDAAREALDHAAAEHAVKRGVHIHAKGAHRSGPLISPSTQGRLFSAKSDATTVMRQLNNQGHTIPTGSRLPIQFHTREPGIVPTPGTPPWRVVTATRGRGSVPLQFTVRQVGDRWAVVPKGATQRLYGGGGRDAPLSHPSVGTSKATGAKLMRKGRSGLTKSTLPFSLKWLGGQGGEALVRALTEGAGPADWLRTGKTAERMNEIRPGAGDEFMAQAHAGGLFDPAGAVAGQVARPTTLAEEFRGAGRTVRTGSQALTYAGQAPGVRQGIAGLNAYTRGVMSGVNGFIEKNARRAMTGQAIKHGPLMQAHFNGLLKDAIDDAAHGLMDTPQQIATIRELDRMYGQYSKWSPEMRSALMHWTPFLPWYLNVARYFASLPIKHPIKTALIADVNEAERQWREENSLALFPRNGGDRKPFFLLGGYPTPGGGTLRLSHYTPWGVGADPLGALAELVLPYATTPLLNARGLDWLGKPLVNQDRTPFGGWHKALRAGTSEAETMIPGLGLGMRLSGLEDRLNAKEGRPFMDRLGSELPWTPTGGGYSSGGGGGGGDYGVPDYSVPDYNVPDMTG